MKKLFGLVLVTALLGVLGEAGEPLSIAFGSALETAAPTSPVGIAVSHVESEGGTILFQEYFDDAGFASRGWYDN